MFRRIVEINILSVFLIFLAIPNVFSSVESLTAAECTNRGFNRIALQCSDCSSLLSGVGDDELHKDCLSCCETKEEEQFQLIVLEMDPRFSSRFPNIADIVKLADSLDVIVRSSVGVRPTLLCYKDRTDDVPFEEINVSSWNVDTFKEYVVDHSTVKEAAVRTVGAKKRK